MFLLHSIYNLSVSCPEGNDTEGENFLDISYCSRHHGSLKFHHFEELKM